VFNLLLIKLYNELICQCTGYKYFWQNDLLGEPYSCASATMGQPEIRNCYPFLCLFTFSPRSFVLIASSTVSFESFNLLFLYNLHIFYNTANSCFQHQTFKLWQFSILLASEITNLSNTIKVTMNFLPPLWEGKAEKYGINVATRSKDKKTW